MHAFNFFCLCKGIKFDNFKLSSFTDVASFDFDDIDVKSRFCGLFLLCHWCYRINKQTNKSLLLFFYLTFLYSLL